MKISRTTTFTRGVADVFAVIATPEHQQAKVAYHSEGSSARVTDLAGGLVGVHTERVVPTTDMPSAVASVVGDTLKITEQQTWRPAGADGTRRADLEIDVDGAPVRLRGTVTLSPTSTGSRLVVDADLTCSLPFVGRKIETAAKPRIEESLDHEVQLLSERLR